MELKGHFVKRGFNRNFVDEQFVRAKVKKREDLLSQGSGKRNNLDKIPLVMNFCLAFSRISRIISQLWPILHALKDMKKVFGENPTVAFRRPKNLRDELVRSELNKVRDKMGGIKKCGKSPFKICTFVEEGTEFEGNNKKYLINFAFNCDSEGVIYLILCKKYRKNYAGSTDTTFSKRFDNHKRSMIRFGKGQRGIPREHLYKHFFEDGHKGLENMVVKMIDKMNIYDPTNREGFWAYKLNPFVPNGLNLKDFL